MNLEKPVFKLLIIKGSQQKEVLRPIKNIAIEFWKEQLKNASPDDYVFSFDFKPGKTKTTTKRMSNKWKEYVKVENPSRLTPIHQHYLKLNLCGGWGSRQLDFPIKQLT